MTNIQNISPPQVLSEIVPAVPLPDPAAQYSAKHHHAPSTEAVASMALCLRTATRELSSNMLWALAIFLLPWAALAAVNPGKPRCRMFTELPKAMIATAVLAAMPIKVTSMLRGTWLAGLQNATQRFDACQSTPLPAASQQYLDTSFLGQRQSLEVESVNYTFFRFGPLQAGLSGVRLRQEELRSA